MRRIATQKTPSRTRRSSSPQLGRLGLPLVDVETGQSQISRTGFHVHHPHDSQQPVLDDRAFISLIAFHNRGD
jgi:hypothetical protein